MTATVVLILLALAPRRHGGELRPSVRNAGDRDNRGASQSRAVHREGHG
jgi:hypothetical protein